MRSINRRVRIEVEATVFGEWCVHRTVGWGDAGEPSWMVSHVSTGWCLGRLLGSGTSYSVACNIAESIASVDCLNVSNPLRVSNAGFMIQAIVGDRLEMEHPSWR